MATAQIPTSLDTAQAQVRTRSSKPFSWGSLSVMTVLFIASIYFLLPFYWLVISATKDTTDLFNTFGFWFSPRFNLFSNLQLLLTYNGSIYLRWLLNSLIYSGVGAAIGTFLSAMAGYALAKYVFRGRDLIFSIILGAILVPATVLVLPLYLMMSAVNLTNTYWAVLLPTIVNPFGVYLSRLYATASVADDLLDAARVDGAGEFRIFLTISSRIMVPALVTVFLFQFVAIWNNYFLPLVMLSDSSLYPIPVGLQTWNSTTYGGTQQFLYSLITTGSLLSVIPLIIGCLLLQRFWRGGLNAGSVKG
ncbi:MAG TPA: carbohydrate ABC transporter permease [Ktedonobacteraceae bacterium]|jgi:multiple sugar transport system permease protein|nr:carbohydrate ABC transporter permease [Ktedonobacteraceae bacterium]